MELKKWLAHQAVFPQKWAPCLLQQSVVHQIKRISKETRLEWEWVNTAAALGRPIKHTGGRIIFFWPFLQYTSDDTKAQRLNWIFWIFYCRLQTCLLLSPVQLYWVQWSFTLMEKVRMPSLSLCSTIKGTERTSIQWFFSDSHSSSATINACILGSLQSPLSCNGTASCIESCLSFFSRKKEPSETINNVTGENKKQG